MRTTLALTLLVVVGCSKDGQPPTTNGPKPRAMDAAPAPQAASLPDRVLATLATRAGIDPARYEVHPKTYDGAAPALDAAFAFFVAVEQLDNASPGQHEQRLVAAVNLGTKAVVYADPDAFGAVARALDLWANPDALTAAAALSIWFELTHGTEVAIADQPDGGVSAEINALIAPPTLRKVAPDGTIVVEGWTHSVAAHYRDKTRHTISITRDGTVTAVTKTAEQLLADPN